MSVEGLGRFRLNVYFQRGSVAQWTLSRPWRRDCSAERAAATRCPHERSAAEDRRFDQITSFHLPLLPSCV